MCPVILKIDAHFRQVHLRPLIRPAQSTCQQPEHEALYAVVKSQLVPATEVSQFAIGTPPVENMVRLAATP